MPNKPEHKLGPYERCVKAFEERWGPRPVDQASYTAWVYHMEGWMSAWRYLESRVTEFIET